MNKFYEEIMNFKGAEELQSLVTKWDHLASNLRSRTFGAPIVLPDIIMHTSHGFGNSTVLELLAEYLDSKKVLMDFSGDVKLLEFAMSYCPPSGQFSELTRLMNSVRTAAGYRSCFKGVVRIVLDHWVGHQEEAHFFELMEYIRSHTDDWLVVLSVTAGSEADVKGLESTVSMYLRTEVVHMKTPDAADLASYADAYIRKFGLIPDESALELLTGSIGKLSEAKHYQSYRTVEMLCSDIVYTLMSGEEKPQAVISADDLKDFAPDSDYIHRRKTQSAKRVPIGF